MSASSHTCPGSNAEAWGAQWQLQCQGVDPLFCWSLLGHDPKEQLFSTSNLGQANQGQVAMVNGLVSHEARSFFTSDAIYAVMDYNTPAAHTNICFFICFICLVCFLWFLLHLRIVAVGHKLSGLHFFFMELHSNLSKTSKSCLTVLWQLQPQRKGAKWLELMSSTEVSHCSTTWYKMSVLFILLSVLNL